MLMRIQRTLDSKCVWDHLLIWEKKFPCVKPPRVRVHCGVWKCHIEGVFPHCLPCLHTTVSVWVLQCRSKAHIRCFFLWSIYHHHLRSLAESPKGWHSRDPAAWMQKVPRSSPVTTDLLGQFPSLCEVVMRALHRREKQARHPQAASLPVWHRCLW